VTTLDDSMIDLDFEDAAGRAEGGPVVADGAEPMEESAARVEPSRWVREAVFREKLRGYHPTDVDAFLDQVAFAFDELEARLRDAEERASKAVGEVAVTVADDETVRRTLTLAQRTAELAITEAERQAADLLERARAESESLVRQAEAEAAAVRDRERSKLLAELNHLESARAIAAEDLDTLEHRRRAEHERLVAILRDIQTVVEERLA
jgi:DivIVA domain-containing protein